MTKFHSDDCIRPDNMSEYNKQMQRCNINNYFLWKHNYLLYNFSQCWRGLSCIWWSLWILSTLCGWISRWCSQTEQASHRNCSQLGWRLASCQEIWSIRFLLCQWHCFGHFGAVEVPPKGSVHWHWHPSRWWGGRSVLHDGSCHDGLISQVWWIFPWHRRSQSK